MFDESPWRAVVLTVAVQAIAAAASPPQTWTFLLVIVAREP